MAFADVAVTFASWILSAALLAMPFAASKRVPIYSTRTTLPAGPSSTSTPIPTAQWFRLQNQKPASNAIAASANPAISATFSDKVNASSVAVSVDGRDVTKDARVSTDAFAVTLPSDLPSGRHTVSVAGMTIGGQQFSQSWSFFVRDGPVSGR